MSPKTREAVAMVADAARSRLAIASVWGRVDARAFKLTGGFKLLPEQPEPPWRHGNET